MTAGTGLHGTDADGPAFQVRAAYARQNSSRQPSACRTAAATSSAAAGLP